MRYRGRRRSSNIQSGGRRPGGGGRLGIGAVVAGLVIYLVTGNPMLALMGTNTVKTHTGQGEVQEIELTDEEMDLYEYSGVVLADTEDSWNEILPEYGVRYREPSLLIFQDGVKTGCGLADSGVGPFYCGNDENIYMDLSFYKTLVNDFGTSEGDFIMSYVISHEVGHHVQKCLGILDKVHQAQARMNKVQANDLSIRLELQADYLAGVVARYQKTQGYLDPGDLEEAISTAWAIGDDTIEKKFQGHVEPESFTHGTSEQRVRWFKKGYEAGDLSDFDSFDMDRYPNAHQL